MRRILALLAIGAVVWAPVRASPQAESTAVGVLPVYDGSQAPFGETMAPTLTLLLFKQLSQLEPVLLNPGGLYTPGDVQSILDYARAVGIRSLIVSTLKSPESGPDRDPFLIAEAFVVDLGSGKPSRTVTARTRVSKSDLEKKNGDVPLWALGASAVTGQEVQAPRQPTGKAAGELAASLAGQLKSDLGTRPPASTSPRTARDQKCDFEFRVYLTQQKVRASNYTIAINGREESSNIVEGLLRLQPAQSGRVMVNVTVKNPPTRVPVQSTYLANTTLDCGRPSRSLVLEIGPEGEGALVWR